MKIALAQINTKLADFKGNFEKIKDRIEWAKKNGVDLIVFPEMVITGYPPHDLLENTFFVLENIRYLEKIALLTDKDFAVIVGCISVNESTTGKGLFNSAAFLRDKKIEYVQNKTLLPTYDVFDEKRYFESGSSHRIVEFNGKKFGITICEDVWSDAMFEGRKLYHIDPVQIMKEEGAEFIVNISASPFCMDKANLRKKLLKNVAIKNELPLFFVNSVGGNDELVFDGRSMVVDKNGVILNEANAFVEDEIIFDMENQPKICSELAMSPIEEVYRSLVLGVRDYISKCGFQRVVIGLSGGIDSAVVSVIARDAIGASNVMGVAMPTRYSSDASFVDAKALAGNLDIAFEVVDIDSLYESYLKILKPLFKDKKEDTTEENIQARIRGNVLMAFSNKYGAMVLSTGNKSEMAVGYCTLYGDMAGGLAVIADVPKTMVYELAKYINREKELIPQNILIKPPSAELKPNQKDEDTLPPYEILDAILKLYVEDHLSKEAIIEMGYDKVLVADVIDKISSSEYKRRQAPPGLKITSKAFGWGRKYPIAAE